MITHYVTKSWVEKTYRIFLNHSKNIISNNIFCIVQVLDFHIAIKLMSPSHLTPA